MADELTPRSDAVKIYTTSVPLLVATSTSTAATVFHLSASAFTSPDVHRPPDNHPIYSYVGRIASEWAHVERTFDLVIWDLAGIDHSKGACITAQIMSVYARTKTIIAQLTDFERKTGISTRLLIADVMDLGNRSNGPGERRNRAVHDPWYVYTDLDKTAQYRAMPAKDLQYGIVAIDREELEGTLDEIKKFAVRALKFRSDVSALLASWRQKSG
jgi:hypothetical protein